MKNLKYPHRCERLGCHHGRGIKICCNYCEENKKCIDACLNDHDKCGLHYVITGDRQHIAKVN